MKVVGQFNDGDLLESHDSEKTYFASNQVTVTNARIILPSLTYVMAGITSVQFEEDKPNRLWPILLILAGIIGLAVPELAQKFSVWAFMVGIVPGLIWLLMQSTKFCIRLRNAAGDGRALNSKNKKFAHDVFEAINTAIIERN